MKKERGKRRKSKLADKAGNNGLQNIAVFDESNSEEVTTAQANSPAAHNTKARKKKQAEKPWVINLANSIDHTLLNPAASSADIARICSEAAEYKFRAVCVNPFNVKKAVKELSSTPVAVATVIGFPLGANLTDIKIAEAQRALFEGAEELDMVMNIGALKDREIDYVLSEIQSIVRVAKDYPVKVIIECDLLDEEEKILATQLCARAGAAMVKTCTGFAKGGKGATVIDVALLKQTADNINRDIGSQLEVKASGGIKDYDQALALIEAGASRLGTSNSVSIIKEARFRKPKSLGARKALLV